MAEIDTTLNSFWSPGLDGDTPPFGRKKTSGKGLSTQEVVNNERMPFTRERPFIITESSSTTLVEADTKFSFIGTETLTLTIGNSKTIGLICTIINKTTLPHYMTASGFVNFVVPSSSTFQIVWMGDKWVELGGVPIASVVSSPLPLVDGYVLCNGVTLDRRYTYKRLFDKIGTLYGAGNGTTTFCVPDWEGLFLRGAGGNAAAVGMPQGDAMRNITGITGGMFIDYIPGTGLFTRGSHQLKFDEASGKNLDSMIFDASAVVPTANENRPTNQAVYWHIKY